MSFLFYYYCTLENYVHLLHLQSSTSTLKFCPLQLFQHSTHRVVDRGILSHISNMNFQFFPVLGSQACKAKMSNPLKGHLISKCHFGVIIWTKIPMKNLTNFCPRIKSGEINKIKTLSYIL